MLRYCLHLRLADAKNRDLAWAFALFSSKSPFDPDPHAASFGLARPVWAIQESPVRGAIPFCYEKIMARPCPDPAERARWALEKFVRARAPGPAGSSSWDCSHMPQGLPFFCACASELEAGLRAALLLSEQNALRAACRSEFSGGGRSGRI